jgi:hypothetical protein
MARFGLPHWLRGRRRNRPGRPTAALQRWRRRFDGPVLEQLEDRNAPGSILVSVGEVLDGTARAPLGSCRLRRFRRGPRRRGACRAIPASRARRRCAAP